MDGITDTTPDAEALLTERLRTMTPEQKLRLTLEMSRTVRELALAGVRSRHPAATEREVFLRLAVVLHGTELAQAAYPEIADLDRP